MPGTTKEKGLTKVLADSMMRSDDCVSCELAVRGREADRDRSSSSERTNDDNVLLNGIEDNVASPAIFDPESSLEETLQLIDLNEVDQFPIDFWQLLSVKTETDDDNIKKEKETEEETKEDPGIEADFLDEELDLLTNMIHAPAPQYHHSRPFQVLIRPLLGVNKDITEAVFSI
ncbi:hypothetical protein V9T40_010960 [Parthenolecanium corni]|uniref:Uncharacterized protein n=1 Tax=Parthenolecanium corni TaxID=536013 RepID=A0AAN9T5Z3_9HEMI